MSRPETEPRLAEIAHGVAAYLQPNGSWGLSNSGLIIGERDCVLVDTLFDVTHTRRMLDAFRKYTHKGDDAKIVVNTHANGDHCYGNVLLREHRIIASNRAVLEMREMPPKKLAALMKAAKIVNGLGPVSATVGRFCKAIGLHVGADFIDAAPYVLAAFSRFDFDRCEVVLPNETFEAELELDLGGRRVRLLELGPAHTQGDVVVYVPETRTLFAGDLLFEGMHPLIWAGTISSYLLALERLLSLEIDVVVPGHGLVTDRSGILRMVDYLRALRDAAEPLYHAGMSAEQAAAKLIQQGFGNRGEPERLVVNVSAAYREFCGSTEQGKVIPLFGAMSRLARM